MFTTNWGASAQAILTGIAASIAALLILVMVISLIIAKYSTSHHDEAMAVFRNTVFTAILIAGAGFIINFIPGL